MLKKIRNALSLSTQDLADRLGVSRALVYDIEAGKREISKKLLGQFVQMGINANWLLTGTGEMFLPSEEEQKPKSRPSLDSLVATKDELAETEEKTYRGQRDQGRQGGSCEGGARA